MKKDDHLYSMLLSDIDINHIKGRKRSRFLTEQDIQKIWGAADYLYNLGLAPNYHITVDFQKGIENALSNSAFKIQPHISEFLNKMRKWHFQNEISFSYIWIVENVSPAHVGQHVHILLHTDPSYFDELNTMITGWLPFERDNLDAPDDKNTNVKVKPMWGLWGLLDYLCKGIDPRLNSTIARKHSGRGQQGYICGLRFGYSKKPLIF